MRLAFTAIVEIIQERSVLKFFRNLKFTISTEVSSPIIAGTVSLRLLHLMTQRIRCAANRL